MRDDPTAEPTAGASAGRIDATNKRAPAATASLHIMLLGPAFATMLDPLNAPHAECRCWPADRASGQRASKRPLNPPFLSLHVVFQRRLPSPKHLSSHLKRVDQAKSLLPPHRRSCKVQVRCCRAPELAGLFVALGSGPGAAPTSDRARPRRSGASQPEAVLAPASPSDHLTMHGRGARTAAATGSAAAGGGHCGGTRSLPLRLLLAGPSFVSRPLRHGCVCAGGGRWRPQQRVQGRLDGSAHCRHPDQHDLRMGLR